MSQLLMPLLHSSASPIQHLREKHGRCTSKADTCIKHFDMVTYHWRRFITAVLSDQITFFAKFKTQHIYWGNMGTSVVDALWILCTLTSFGLTWEGMWKSLSVAVAYVTVNTTFNAIAKQLNSLPILGSFYRWGVDLAGPLNPTSSAGRHKYVMVTIEHFTKLMDVTPIADKSAATTAQVFLEIFVPFW